MSRSRTVALSSIAAFAFIAGGLILPNLTVRWRGVPAAADGRALVDPATISPQEIFARAAAIAAPAVVSIDTVKRVRVRGWMFEDYVERVPGAASGVIVSADGDVLTNEHVVAGVDSITVTLLDGRQFQGKVVGTDRSTDVALVNIKGPNLPVAKIGASSRLIPGQIAVAIGNPLGLRFTVTSGIVSALGRPVKMRDRSYENLIQTDCAINPGNSGGALVDREGRIIGVNTLVAEQANGVGFAIPIDTAMRISGLLKKFGRIKRPWTGLYTAPITEDIQRYLGLPSAEGALIQGVAQGSPADDAGLRRGDILLELDGVKVRDDDHFNKLVAALPIGKKVRALVQRESQKGSGEIVIGEAP